MAGNPPALPPFASGAILADDQYRHSGWCHGASLREPPGAGHFLVLSLSGDQPRGLVADFHDGQRTLPCVHIGRRFHQTDQTSADNLVIVALVLVFFPPPISLHLLLFPAALFFVVANALWVGILLGLMCARFRDIPQIIASLMQVALFLTPVMWKADMLGRNIFAAKINPLFHFLEIVRQPLLGGAIPTTSWLVVIMITGGGYLIALGIFARFRARIAYWV
jgi:ABC-type polysaccharide/polyol phosphate export permease